MAPVPPTRNSRDNPRAGLVMLNNVPSLPRRIASDLNAKLRSAETAAAVAQVEGKLTRRRRNNKMQSGAFRGMHVIVYRGYVADNVAKVRVRVVEEPELPGDSRIPYWDVMQANLRRHGALAIVGVDVELRIAGNTAHEVTDSAASPTSRFPYRNSPAGWHDAHAVTTPIEDGESASGSGRVAETSSQSSLRSHLRHR